MLTGETAERPSAGKLLAWWVGELATLVPARLRGFLPADRVNLEIEITPETVSVRRLRGARREPVATFDRSLMDSAALRSSVERTVGSFGRGRRSAALRLSDPHLLFETIRLPAAAAGNIRETVLYQLDRLTPFSADEVYFDCRQSGPPASDGLIPVELIVAPRRVIDDAVGLAATWSLDAASLSPAGDDPQGPSKALNLLPREAVRNHSGLGRVNGALAILALFLFGASLYLPYARDRETAKLLSARVELLRAEARVAAGLNEQMAAAEKDRDRIADRRRNAISVTRTLNELTRLLPDSSWVSQFRLTGNQAQIVGHAPSSSEIIGLIEQSDRFSGARMLAPVRRDASGDIERFNLSFSMHDEAARNGAGER